MYLTTIKANRTNPQLTSYSLVKAEHFKNALWSFLFNKVLEVQPEQTGKKKKGIKIANTEVKLSLFSDDMMLYIQTLKNLQKKKKKKRQKTTVRTCNKFDKVPDYKIKIQKSTVFLYIDYEQLEKKKQSHLKQHQKE